MQYWFPNVRPGISHDSYSTLAEGKKAFYLVMRREAEKRGLSVARSFQPLDQQLAGTPARELPARLNRNEPPALSCWGQSGIPTRRNGPGS
jgi:hypothetical protein